VAYAIVAVFLYVVNALKQMRVPVKVLVSQLRSKRN
jgi:uncharacterized protein YlxP (DUF503 family)